MKAYRDELNALIMNDNVPFSSSTVPQSVYYDDDDDYEHHPHKHYQQSYQGNQQYNHPYNPNHPHYKKKKVF